MCPTGHTAPFKSAEGSMPLSSFLPWEETERRKIDVNIIMEAKPKQALFLTLSLEDQVVPWAPKPSIRQLVECGVWQTLPNLEILNF